jgi:uncharacterized protein (DUF305 family)
MQRVRTIHTVRTALVAGTVALGLVSAACGGSGAAPPPGGQSATAARAHGAADVTFAQHMIPQHRQALELAALARTRAARPEVAVLATEIAGAQQPEIDRMTAWLAAWGAPVPAGHVVLPGMVTDADLAALRAATGAAFDRRFLTLMIAHHEGAVRLARTEVAEGRDPAATALAEEIVATQGAEIAVMRGLLGPP